MRPTDVVGSTRVTFEIVKVAKMTAVDALQFREAKSPQFRQMVFTETRRDAMRALEEVWTWAYFGKRAARIGGVTEQHEDRTVAFAVTTPAEPVYTRWQHLLIAVLPAAWLLARPWYTPPRKVETIRHEQTIDVVVAQHWYIDPEGPPDLCFTKDGRQNRGDYDRVRWVPGDLLVSP